MTIPVELRCDKIEIEIRPSIKGDIHRTRSANDLWGSCEHDVIDPDFPETYPETGQLLIVIRAEVSEAVKDKYWPYSTFNRDRTIRVITDDIQKGFGLLATFLDEHPQYFRETA